MSNKLIILDRDGVINHDSPNYIKSLDEFKLIDGSLEAISLLKKNGYKVVIATNQSGVARGLFSSRTLDNIHNYLAEQLATVYDVKLDAIYVCTHLPNVQNAKGQNLTDKRQKQECQKYECSCRKPKAGMLKKAITQFNADKNDTWMIGDAIRDIQAGIAAECQVALVETGKGLKTIADEKNSLENVPIYKNLYHFTQYLISHNACG